MDGDVVLAAALVGEIDELAATGPPRACRRRASASSASLEVAVEAVAAEEERSPGRTSKSSVSTSTLSYTPTARVIAFLRLA
jgi:hypothetical protein